MESLDRLQGEFYIGALAGDRMQIKFRKLSRQADQIIAANPRLVLKRIEPSTREPTTPMERTRQGTRHRCHRVRFAPEPYRPDDALLRIMRAAGKGPKGAGHRLGGVNLELLAVLIRSADYGQHLLVRPTSASSPDDDLELLPHHVSLRLGLQLGEELCDVPFGTWAGAGEFGNGFSLDESAIHGVRMHVRAEQSQAHGLPQDGVIGMAKGEADGGDPHGTAIGEGAFRVHF